MANTEDNIPNNAIVWGDSFVWPNDDIGIQMSQKFFNASMHTFLCFTNHSIALNIWLSDGVIGITSIREEWPKKCFCPEFELPFSLSKFIISYISRVKFIVIEYNQNLLLHSDHRFLSILISLTPPNHSIWSHSRYSEDAMREKVRLSLSVESGKCMVCIAECNTSTQRPNLSTNCIEYNYLFKSFKIFDKII